MIILTEICPLYGKLLTGGKKNRQSYFVLSKLFSLPLLHTQKNASETKTKNH